MPRRDSKHTKVYMGFKDGAAVHCVRLWVLETKEFPHGLALAPEFPDEKQAEQFADAVDNYIEQIYRKK